MICNNCGAQLSDTAAFCTVCGETIQKPEPAPVVKEESAPAQGNTQKKGIAALVWGIIGFCFSSWGLLGLIFSIVGKNQANNYEKTYGSLDAPAKIGKGFATAGFIIGLILTILYALVAFFGVIGGIADVIMGGDIFDTIVDIFEDLFYF